MILFPLDNKIADRHVARDERDGVGELGKSFLFVGLDMDDDRVPRARIGGMRRVCRILHETQNERFHARTIGRQS